MFGALTTGLHCTWQRTVGYSRLFAHLSNGVRTSMREIRGVGHHCTQPFMVDPGHLMTDIWTWCGIYWNTVRTWTLKPTPNTRHPSIWRRTGEALRSHSCYSTMVQISTCGTRM